MVAVLGAGDAFDSAPGARICTGVMSDGVPSSAGPLMYGVSLTPDHVVFVPSIPVRLAWLRTFVPFVRLEARVTSNWIWYWVLDGRVKPLTVTVPAPLVPQVEHTV